MFKTKKNGSTANTHTKEVVRKSFSSTLVKGGGMAATLLSSVLLGRTLGPDGVGIINLTNRIANIMLVFTMFGMQSYLVKEIAISRARKDFKYIGDLMRTSYIFNGLLSFTLVIIFLILVPWMTSNVFKDPNLEIPLMIAVVAVIPMTFSRIFRSGMNGYRKVWQSNLVDQALSVWVVCFLLLVFMLFKFPITVLNVAIIYAFSRIVVVTVTGFYWNSLYKSISSNFILDKIIKSAYALFLVNASSIIAANADAVLIGWLGSTRDVGLYSVAARIALLTSFFLQVTSSVLSPKIATFHANQESHELKKIVNKVTSALIYIGAISLVAFIVFGDSILGLWGEEFKEAYWVLVILGIGQFVNLSTGAVGLILIMTGHERVQSRISLISVFSNIILNVILIKFYGIMGAAFATAFTVSTENIVKYYFVKFKYRIL